MGESDQNSDAVAPEPSVPILEYEIPGPSDNQLILVLKGLGTGIALLCILFALAMALVGAFVGGVIYAISTAASDKTLSKRLRVLSALAVAICVLGLFIIFVVIWHVGDMEFILHPSLFRSFEWEFSVVWKGLWCLLGGILLFASIRSYAWRVRRRKPSTPKVQNHDPLLGE